MQETSIRIMTGAIISSVMDVLNYYRQRYEFAIRYYIEMNEVNDTPRFVIYINKIEINKEG